MKADGAVGQTKAAPTKTAAKSGLSFSLGSQKQTVQPQDKTEEDDICPIHKKKLEIVCITCMERICSKCALFGDHKSHTYREEDDVHAEINDRKTRLLDTMKELQ